MFIKLRIVFFLTVMVIDSHALELKSHSVKDNPRIQNLEQIKCTFIGRAENNQKYLLNSEVFKIKDLKNISQNKKKGVYVNIFDFLGFQFFLDVNNKFTIKAEKEEQAKKIIKKYSRLPASFSTQVSFSSNYNSKPVYIKEVIIECKP